MRTHSRRSSAWIETHQNNWEIVAVGHRVVHGGASFTGTGRLDEPVLQQLKLLAPLAPASPAA